MQQIYKEALLLARELLDGFRYMDEAERYKKIIRFCEKKISERKIK